MRKTATAVLTGSLLVASHALAADSNITDLRDRVGVADEGSNELAGIPYPVLLIGGVVLAAAIAVAADDDSDSNRRSGA